MRVAVNTRFLLPGALEGMGRFTLEVCRQLVERHPDWEFLFLFDRPYAKAYVLGPNVKPIVVYPPARHPFLWSLWYEGRIPYLLRKYRADVFFSPDNFCSLRTRVPTVMVVHDLAYCHFPEQIPPAHLRFYRKQMPRYCRRAECIVTVSDFTRQDLIRQFDLPPDKVRVACNGARAGVAPLNETAVQEVRKRYSRGCPYFLYVGAIHPRKNIARLIRAFDRFKKQTDSPVQLVLAGRLAWQTAAIERALADSPFREAIHLTGYVDEEELPRLLGAALALTYVSLFEGFGIPVLEAMQAEVPVISSNVSALPEVTGEAALLVDPESEGEMATAMQRIWAEENLRKALVNAGKVQREEFSWEKAADVVEQAMEEIMKD